MNHPQIWTTINKTAIDRSLLPVDIVPLTDSSIYAGLLSEHLAVLLEIQNQYNTERVSVPKRWLAQHADWELYCEHITTATTSIELTYIDTNEANKTKAILEAAELSIPKSSGKISTTPYWKNNMGITNYRHTDDIHRRPIWSKYKLHTRSTQNSVPM